jgi:hypothetical protein
VGQRTWTVTALTVHLNGVRYTCGLTGTPVRRLWRAQSRQGGGRLGTMQYLLILLVAVTVGCGAAATVTIALAPAYADAGAKGYYSEANP